MGKKIVLILYSRPPNIYNLLPSVRRFRGVANSFNTVSCRSEYIKKSIIPNVVNEWNKLDPGIHKSTLYNFFCNTLLKFNRPTQTKTSNIDDLV